MSNAPRRRPPTRPISGPAAARRRAATPVLVLAIGVATGCAAVGPTAPVAPRAAPALLSSFQDEGPAAPVLPPSIERQLRVLRSALLTPSSDIDRETRLAAAEELLALEIPQADEVLARGLREGNADIVGAIAVALRDVAAPVGGLLDPAVSALLRLGPDAQTDLARAVGRYGLDGIDAIAVVLLGGEHTPEQRVAAARALPAFRRREAAGPLLPLLDPARGEAADLQQAAVASLEALSGLGHGRDFEAWRLWWLDAPDDDRDAHLESRIERLATQNADLQRSLDAEQGRVQRLEQRLHEVFRRLFPLQSYEEQLERLPRLLEDDLAVVRAFAVGRIERILRDGVGIPQTLQVLLADRLADPRPEIRLQAAQLLDELGFDQLPARLAERLAVEENAVVIEGGLRILARRPAVQALPAIEKWIADPVLARPAADAIWAVTLRHELDEATRARIRDAVRAVGTESATPEARAALSRLLGFVGDDTDAVALVGALDGSDPALRAAVAEGFARAGRRQPLVDRADRPDIYPHALAAVAGGPADLARLQAILRLAPPPEMEPRWRETVREIAGRVDGLSVLAIEEQLAGAGSNGTRTLRRDLLLDLQQREPGAIAPEVRGVALERLVPLLLELGEPQQAVAVLDTPANAPVPATLSRLRFRAMLWTGAWDRAAELDADPRTWIDALAWLAPIDATAGRALLGEIERRHGPNLDAPLRRRLDSAAARLPAAVDAGSAVESSDDVQTAAAKTGDTTESP